MKAFITVAVVTLAPSVMEATKRHVRYRMRIKSISRRRHEKRLRTCEGHTVSYYSMICWFESSPSHRYKAGIRQLNIHDCWTALTARPQKTSQHRHKGSAVSVCLGVVGYSRRSNILEEYKGLKREYRLTL